MTKIHAPIFRQAQSLAAASLIALSGGSTALGQAFFDITQITSGTNDSGQAATGYSETDTAYTVNNTGGFGGASGTYTNGPISGVWSIQMLTHPTIFDGATSNNATPVAQAPGTTTGSGGSINRNNAFVYDVSPTGSASGIGVSVQGVRGTNQPLELQFSGAPTNLSGSIDDPIPMLSIYPVPPSVQGIPFTSWGYGFDVFNHATDYTPSWDNSINGCPAILGEPNAGEVNGLADTDQIASGQTIDSVPANLSDQSWFVNLPPNVDTATMRVEGFRYYDVMGFDILYYDTQLTVAVEPATTALGLCPNTTDEGDQIRVVYSLTNTGDVDVLNPSVTDPVLGTVDATGVSGGSGTSGGYVSGDTDGDGELDVDETWVFEIFDTITAAEYGTSISTLGGTQVTSRAEPRYCAAEPVQSEAPRIINYPDAPVSVTVQKCSVGNADSFDFSFDNLSNTTHTFNMSANQTPGGNCETLVNQCASNTDSPVVMTETVPAGWNLDSANCNSASGGTLSGSELTLPTSDLTPGANITCTFNNEEQVELTLIKAVPESNGDFTFTTTNTDLGDPTISAAAGSSGSVTGFITDADAATTVGETLPTGWSALGFSCQNLTQGTAINGGTGEVSASLPASFYDPGDEVRCTFRNEREKVNLVIDKEWGNITSAVSVDIDVSGPGSGSASGTSSTSTSATDTSVVSLEVFAGDTITMTETVLSGFTQNLVCDNVSPTGETTATFDVPSPAPASITCRFINIEYPNLRRWLQFTKETEGAPASFDFSASNATIPAGTVTLDTTTGNPASSDFYELGTPGSDLVITETLVPGYTLSSDTQCYNVHSGSPIAVTTNIDPVAGTITVPNNQLNGNSKIICEIVNSADEYEVDVNKTWVNPETDTSSTTIRVTGNSSDDDTVTAPTNGASVAQTTFYVNGIVTIEETALPNYTASLACVPRAGGTAAVITGSNPWTVDTNGNTSGFDCTITNTRNETQLNLTKTWADSLPGDEVDIEIRTPGAGSNRLFHQSNSTGGDVSTNGGSMTVYGGEALAITEDDLSADGYTQTLVCMGGASVTENATGQWTADIPDTFTGDIDCEITNDRAAGDLIIQKNVTNATDGTFGFASTTLDPNAFNITTVGGTASQTFANVTPGTYDVTEAAQAGWNLNSVVCDNGSGTANIGTGALTGITVADGETVTCSFNNRRNTGDFQLQKNWVDAQAGVTATLNALGDDASNIAWTTSAAPAGNSSETSPIFTVYGLETVTLSETVSQPGYTASAWTCDNGITVGADGSFEVPGSPPPVITCQVTNTLVGIPLDVDKQWINAEVGATAEISINGINGDTQTSTADTASETDADVVEDDLIPGQPYTISEEELPGYDQTLACTGATVGATTGAGSGTLQFPITPSATATEVECTLTNERRSADLRVVKSWVNAAPGDTAAISVASTTEPMVNFSQASPSGTSSSTLGTTPIYAGDTITVNETAIPGYTTTLSCDNGTSNAAGGSGSWAVDLASPADVTCTWTNTRNSTLVTVQKVWVNPAAGANAQFSMTVDGTAVAVSDSNQGAATGTVTETVLSNYQVFEGEVLNLAETSVSGGYSVSAFTCDTLTMTPTGPGAGTTTLSATPPATATCSVTNTRNAFKLLLNKTWNNAGASDLVDLTASVPARGVSQTVTSTANATDAEETEVDNNINNMGGVLPLEVLSGETVSLGEAFTPAADAALYDTTLTCADGLTPLTVTGDAFAATIEVPLMTTNPDPAIGCTWTNTRKTAELTLVKTWIDAEGGDSTTLTVDGIDTTDISTSSTVPGAGYVATHTDTITPTMTIYAGETLTLSEPTLPTGYTAELVCEDALGTVTSVTTTTTGNYTVPDGPEDVTCTWTNTRIPTTFNVVKEWVNSAIGDTGNISVTGGQNAPGATNTITADGTDADQTVTSFTAFAGETITMVEDTVPAGYEASAFVCEDSTGGSLAVTAGGAATIPDAPDTSYTCTVTNTKRQAELSLQKTWVNPAPGDEVEPSATGVNGSTSLTATAIGGLGNEIFTLPAANTLTVNAGETITLSEGTVPPGYDVTLTCADTSGALTVTAGAGPGEGSFIVPALPTDMSCEWTNTRRTAQLILNKTWVNAAIGETTTLSATGLESASGPATANNALDASETISSVAFMTIYANETILLSETVPAGYDATLTCDMGTFSGTATAGSLTVSSVPQDTNCTWTNTRRSTTFNLEKNWVNPHAGASADLEALGTTTTVPGTNVGDPPVTVTSTFDEITSTTVTSTGLADTNQVAGTMTVYAGESFELAETNLSTGYTAGTWTCEDASGAVTVLADTVTVPDNPDDTLTCQITNTRDSVNLQIDKQWTDSLVGNSANISIDGIDDASGTSTATAVDILDTNVVNGPIYAGETLTISEPAIPGYDSTLVCDDGTVAGVGPDWTLEVPFTQTADVTCTLENDRRPTLQLAKVSNGSVGTFDFTTTNTTPAAARITTTSVGTQALGPAMTITDLSLPITLSEAPQFGWDTVSITCTDQNGTVASNAGLNALTLSPADFAMAEDMVCEFVNETSTDDLAIEKSVSPKVASEGEIVTYTITLTNTTSLPSLAGQIQDIMPAGLTYVAGTAEITDSTATAQLEPALAGQQLTWVYPDAGGAPLDSFDGGETLTITYDALVVDGTTRDAINTVVHTDAFGVANSVPAQALLTILEDPGMICSTIIGTVYDTIDQPSGPACTTGKGCTPGKNGELPQDVPRDRGLAGVRIVTPDGQVVTTDDQGRYSLACVRTRGARGAESRINSVPLKLVESTLPFGYEVDGFNPQIVTTTPGKVSVANFGAHYTGVDNKTCSVPFTEEEAETKAAQGIHALSDSAQGDEYCRDAFWFITAQLRTEGDGSNIGQNRTATDGKITVYFKGYITGKTLLTLGYEASGSTLEDFTSGVLAPDVERILDDIEDEDLFPIFADRSTTVDDTPTSGGFYIRLEREDDRLVFGDTELKLVGNTLVPVDRDVYGLVVDVNWDGDQDGSNPSDGSQIQDGGDGKLTIYGTTETFSRSNEVFTGLGNSAFFLSQVNVVPGSLSAEIRVTDTISGQLLERISLAEGPHFWVDEAGGVLRLSQPLMSFLPGVSAGTTVALYVSYDFIPASLRGGGTEYGGRIEVAPTDDLTLGATAVVREDGVQERELLAADAEWRFGEKSYVRIEIAQSKGTAPGVLVSNDGGATFTLLPGTSGEGTAATIAFDLDSEDMGGSGWRLSGYLADVDDDFAALDAGTSAQAGVGAGLNLELDVSEDVTIELDLSGGDIGGANETTRASLGAQVQVNDNVSVDGAVIAGSDQGNTAIGIQVGTTTTSDDGKANVRVEGSTTLEQEAGAPDLDSASLTYTQELEDGGSVGATIREDASGTEVGISYASDEEGPLQTYAQISQTGSSFGDTGNAWFTSGFRYSANDQVMLYGETRQSLGDPAQQNKLVLVYDNEDSTISLSAAYDRDLKFETTSLSMSYGWEGDVRTGAIRVEVSEQRDLATGQIRDITTFTYKGNTFEQGPLETSLTFDYVGNEVRGGTGFDDAHAAELEAAVAYRGGENDEFVLLLIYKADYNFAPTGQGGVGSTNHEFEQMIRLDLTYRINPWLTIGGAYAARATYSSATRLGDVELDQIEQLGIIRLDAKVGKRWGVVIEGRAYTNSTLTNMQVGMVEYVYFDISENARIAVGYSQSQIGPTPDSLGATDEGWFIELNAQY